jgi:hypothetical protein
MKLEPLIEMQSIRSRVWRRFAVHTWLLPFVQDICGLDARHDDLVAAVDEMSARFAQTKA